MTNSKLVWTSDPEKAKELRASAPPSRDAEAVAQAIRVTLDKKRRAGKKVTVASGFELTAESLAKVATVLKKRCGSGGTARDGEIEIQGDHVDSVAGELRKLGYKVK